MLTVNIPRKKEEVTYYVYDKGELIQFISMPKQSYLGLDKTIQIDNWQAIGNNIIVQFSNLTPVIISEDSFNEYLEKQNNKNKYFDRAIEKIPALEITDTDYDMLKTLYEYQTQNERQELDDDLERAWQYVRNDIKPDQGLKLF